MLTNRREIQIEWGDCDPFGIVFFPRYFEYFDACTNALFHKALGISKAEMLRKYEIKGIPLVQASCNFLLPSSFGDVVAVEGFEKRVWTGHVHGELTKGKSKPIPNEVMEKFK